MSAPTPALEPERLLWHDASLIIVSKPSGLLAVPGRGADKADCLAARVQARFADALTVHRLDMATSGLMVFARGAAMQRALSIAFAQRQVEKRYTAVVAGRLAKRSGEITLPLSADWPNRPRQKVDLEGGKPSHTRYRELAHLADAQCSRVELQALSGRSHQLRVHMQAIGHPILGDEFYADAASFAAAPRLLLHASTLGFTHPATGQPCHFDEAAPF